MVDMKKTFSITGSPGLRFEDQKVEPDFINNRDIKNDPNYKSYQ